jgi:hypothetical protein
MLPGEHTATVVSGRTDVLSPKPHQKLRLLITNVPLDKDFLIKVSQGHIEKFKVTQSIEKKSQILTFLVNISKIIEIPTLKAYAFLFLVSRNI